ncbi:MAG TPA: carboxypeptidase regulatory-like domain-containing protein [Saprospiraceae bacterium]|nr:carboxypeptidase regulatory-like domain-containing protein [Saprospiraceae bacterium]
MKLLFSVIAFFTLVESYCQTGTISGHVYDRNDNTALVGCTVQLLDSRYGEMVGSDGNYKIDRIPHGTYDLVAYFLSKGDSTVTQVQVSAR